MEHSFSLWDIFIFLWLTIFSKCPKICKYYFYIRKNYFSNLKGGSIYHNMFGGFPNSAIFLYYCLSNKRSKSLREREIFKKSHFYHSEIYSKTYKRNSLMGDLFLYIMLILVETEESVLQKLRESKKLICKGSNFP